MDANFKTYDSTTKLYALEQINFYYHDNRLNFNLDCQRGTVWTESQKQDLIDTLMCDERIPEVHVIKEDNKNIFEIADGKQRLTTLLDFINNQLIWKAKYADPAFLFLFGDSKEISFDCLPIEYQNSILSTEITFATYKNMTNKAITKLFRKLNSGTPLSAFQKGMAENISLRKEFSMPLLSHPAIQKIFSENKIKKDNAEADLVGLLAMMLACDKYQAITPIDITDGHLFDYNKNDLFFHITNISSEDEYNEWAAKLTDKSRVIIKYLDILNKYFDVYTRSKAQFIFPILYAYYFDMSEKEFMTLFYKMKSIQPKDIIGGGAQYVTSSNKKWIDLINNKLL